MRIKPLLVALALGASSLLAQAYVVGGPTKALTPNSFEWAWDGSYLAPFRAAQENPANFGPGGVVNRSISTVDLNTVDAASLAGVDMFVGTWVIDFEATPMAADVLSFFLGGGDLFLLQDDAGHDALGSALGISTTTSSGSVSNGGAPFFSGAFGSASDVTQHFLTGQLDEAAILAKGGAVVGRNVQNQVTSAYWAAGQYAPGAGALFIVADIDMIATTPPPQCGQALCGADDTNMNANAVYALNTFSFLQRTGGNPNPLPEPGTVLLAVPALLMLGWTRRRRQRG